MPPDRPLDGALVHARASQTRLPALIADAGDDARRRFLVSIRKARVLLDSLDTTTLVGLRDRALLGVMVYTFARVGAVMGLRVEDYYQNGKRWAFRLHEKGGKRHEVPAHHHAEAYVDTYLDAVLWGGSFETRTDNPFFYNSLFLSTAGWASIDAPSVGFHGTH